MKWVLIALAILIALAMRGYIRNSYLPPRRVKKFLEARGVELVRLEMTVAYAWPGYHITFQNEEMRTAFSNSPDFEALLEEVQAMHGDLQHGDQEFDARQAVSLAPTSGTDWGPTAAYRLPQNRLPQQKCPARAGQKPVDPGSRPP